MDSNNNEVQILGEPQVRLIGTSQDDDASNERAEQPLADKKSVVLIVKGKVDTDESEGTIFYSNMSGGFHCRNSRGNWKGANSGRGGTPLGPPLSYMGMPPHPGPPTWGQPPWQGMPYYPPYMPMPSLLCQECFLLRSTLADRVTYLTTLGHLLLLRVRMLIILSRDRNVIISRPSRKMLDMK